MNTTTLSPKYQVVIPKKVREAMELKIGEKVILQSLDKTRALLVKQPADYTKALQGLGKDLWHKLGGADKYIKQERASWNKK